MKALAASSRVPNEREKGNAGYHVKYKDGYESWSPAEPFKKSIKCAGFVSDRLHIEMRDLYTRMDNLAPFIESGKIDEVVNR